MGPSTGWSCLSFKTCTRHLYSLNTPVPRFELPFQRQWAICLQFTRFILRTRGGSRSRTNAAQGTIFSWVFLLLRSDLLLCSGSPRRKRQRCYCYLSTKSWRHLSTSTYTGHTYLNNMRWYHIAALSNHYLPTSFPQVSPGEILELDLQALKSGLGMSNLDRQSFDPFVTTIGIHR